MNCNVDLKLSNNPALSQAFADARDSLAAARESLAGSWCIASVLRKRESLINALSEAVQSGALHVDLVDALDGSGAYDTEEERADNQERDMDAIASIRPLIEVLVGAGMTISGIHKCDASPGEETNEALKTWFRDPVAGTSYPSIESVRKYLPEGRTVVTSTPPAIEVRTVTGRVYSLHPVWMDRMPSKVAADWLRFQGAHVPGTMLDETMQSKIQRHMREHRTECLTNHREYFTLAGGMLALCDPKPFQNRRA